MSGNHLQSKKFILLIEHITLQILENLSSILDKEVGDFNKKDLQIYNQGWRF